MTESGTSQEAALALIVFDLDGTHCGPGGDRP
jgi:hypothetical protein